MAGWSLSTLLTLGVLCVLTNGPTPCSGVCNSTDINANRCFEVVQELKASAEAQAACAQRARAHGYHSAQLAAPSDAITNSFLNDVMLRTRNTARDPYYFREMLLGGMEKAGTPVWKWTSECQECGGILGDRIVGRQGCFTENPTNPDLPYHVTPATVTPDTCVTACRQGGYSWAGLMARDPRVGRYQDKCSCGYTHGDEGKHIQELPPNNCSRSCMDDAAQRCGGTNQNEVFRVGGAYAVWASNQPNYYDEKQFCAVLAMSSFYNYKLVDETCHSYLGFKSLCEIPLSECFSGHNYRRVNYDVGKSRCIYVNAADSRFTWYKARAKCVSIGGDLLAIDSELFKTALKNVLLADFPHEKYWVGLNSRPWTWPNGEKMIFTDWETEQQTYSKTKNCMVAKYAYHLQPPRYWWSNKACSEQAYFVCQYDLTTEPATTVATSTANTVVITTTATASTHRSDTPTTASRPITTTQLSTISTWPATTTTKQELTTAIPEASTTTSTTTIPTIKLTTSAAPTPVVITTTASNNNMNNNKGVTTPTPGTATPVPVVTTGDAPGVPVTQSTPTKGNNSNGINGGNSIGVTPVAGRSSANSQGLTTFEIVLIVILVILIIIIIVGIIICIVYKKKESHGRVNPNVYDARKDADRPCSGAIRDEVYLPPSETGSTSGLIADNKMFGASYDIGNQHSMAYGNETNPNRISIGNN